MRLRSLDVFRGLTVAGMVIVNNPGDWNAVYWPLLHAEWHGWTPTDLIFPFFLFIVGVAMPLGRERGWRTILRRSAVILALGLFVSGFPFFRLDTWRIPGVLQRIALCYLAGAALLRATRRLTPRARKLTVAGMAVACLLVYWVLLGFVPVPGGSAGDLSAEGNLGAWLDRQLMAGHLWRQGWDPEGLLSTMPAIATTLLGILAGWLLAARGKSPTGCEAQRRVAPGDTETAETRPLFSVSRSAPARSLCLAGRRAFHHGLLAEGARGEPVRARDRWNAVPAIWALVAWGAAGVVIGLAWDVVFPINKSLWTSSYAIFTSGLAALGLAACHWWVDMNDTPYRRRLTEPLVALGRNALLLFVLSGLLAKIFIYLQWPDASMPLGRWLFVQLFEPLGPPRVASLLYAFANLALLGGVCWFLHRRGRYFTA